MTTAEYVSTVNKFYQSGIATEHTFRGPLAELIGALIPEITITNEPKQIDCGAPDYVLTQKEVPVGFIEAKDVGDTDLLGKKKSGHKEQFDRYKASLENLIFTDYLTFHLFHQGELVTTIQIGEVENGQITPLSENFPRFENLIKDFPRYVSQTIRSPKKLAEMMAGKARLLFDVIDKALTSDEKNEENSSLQDQKEAFKQILIHDITPSGFADIYAQTIAYGMFAARLHDDTLDNFNRQEAAELIPKSNPFLRKLFGYIAGPELDERIKWIVEDLAHIFLHTNIREILKDYGKKTRMQNPIIHFYETFLSEYDPKLRKARGVWYTPAPVVDFIVRGVDEILKTEFGLTQGLADTSQTEIEVNTDIQDKRSTTGYKRVKKKAHKVQILDPATGTGTFLAQVIQHIHQKFKGQEGIWSSYVEEHLIPRLNGFELLMASYAMAHLQLDLLLNETGYKPTSNQRLNVFLTNSLEEASTNVPNLFMARWLTEEATQADRVKRDQPVMVVLGNPPYSGISSNKGKWILDLLKDYKKEPGGKIKLQERKHWLNDDYVKFIRYGQHYIEKNGSGVLAFINPHGFLDNPTFRGMRWKLLDTFDKIYTLDLHGNAKKREMAPDGSKDENVFDIMQGVAINFFIKTGRKKNNELAKVFHSDLYGRRNFKYDFLNGNSISSADWNELEFRKPNYFFVPKDYKERDVYKKGFSLEKLFPKNVTGIVTARDSVVIDFDKEVLLERIEKFINAKFSDDEIRDWLFPNKKEGKYLKGDSRGWKLTEARKIIQHNDHENIIKKYNYRPFDFRNIYYSPSMIDWGREEVMVNFNLQTKNLGLVFARQTTTQDWSAIQVVDAMIDNRFHFSYKGIPQQAPLYIQLEKSTQTEFTETDQTPIPNLDTRLVAQIEKELGLTLKVEPEALFDSAKDQQTNFAPVDLLDYIYAILHSSTYREKYKEFLKIDFPRIPYPKDQKEFWQLVSLGSELRQIHLLESPVVEDYITAYPVGGNNEVGRKITKTSPGFVADKENSEIGKVWINDEQYFDKVPKIAWEFYIGGYQPAQKWLKDRRDRTLSFEDILHYQKIIVALAETDRIMKEIDKIEFIDE